MIEYSHAVMEAVREQAVRGLTSPGRLEIGGVLYGERRNGVVRILACAPLVYDHMRGPGFLLSEKDEAAFRDLMKPPPGMRTVGWYCSHLRSGLALNANDCAIMERFFGDRSVVLIVKPTHFGPVEATFYLKGVAEPGPHFSVLVARTPLPAAVEPEPPSPPAPAPPPPQPGSVPASLPETLPAAALQEPAVRYRRPKRWHWVWAAFVSILLMMAYFGLRPAATTARMPERLGLRAYNMSGRQIQIQWNRQSPAIRAAKSGTLEIADGTARYALPLSAEQLRSSSLTYGRRSDVISVVLRLDNGARESVQLVVAPARESATTPTPPPAVSKPPQPTAPSTAARRAPLKRFVIGDSLSPSKPDRVDLPEPPPTAWPSPTPESVMLPKVPVAPPAPIAAPAPHVPRSGRLIWTGSLDRRGVVKFEGSTSTPGSLSGGLPGAAATLAVYPAEIAPDGLIVYVPSADRNNQTEGPGPQTGWNRLRFVWDPKRASEITVLESPNSENRYSRLAVRNESRRCSAIVVEWTAQ